MQAFVAQYWIVVPIVLGWLFLVTGIAALVAVKCAWTWLSVFYRESWAKSFVAICRFAVALMALQRIIPQSVRPTISDWQTFHLTMLAVSSWFFWEISGSLGDQNLKDAKDNAKKKHEEEMASLRESLETVRQDKDDAVRLFERQGVVRSCMRNIVNEKRERLIRLMESSEAVRGSLPAVREALAPGDQINFILQEMAVFFRMDAGHARGTPHNFRVGLYVEQEGILIPVEALDLAARSRNPFTSHEDCTKHFKLDDGENPSQAVLCVRTGKLCIVSDCSSHAGFGYFRPEQADYLKSLAAFPMANLRQGSGPPLRAALVIDTDKVGYFNEKDRELLTICLEEFAARIELEYAIRGLVERRIVRKEGKDGAGNDEIEL